MQVEPQPAGQLADGYQTPLTTVSAEPAVRLVQKTAGGAGGDGGTSGAGATSVLVVHDPSSFLDE